MNEQLAEAYVYQDVLQIKPNATILDVTAGNRHIWGQNKYSDKVLFCDKETELKIKPDLICKWDELPFRDNSFQCIVFDPPFYCGNAMPYFTQPNEIKSNGEKGYWYGYPFKNKYELRIQILKAQKEFARIAPRLCFKWMDRDLTVDQALTLFTEWSPVWIQPQVKRNNGYVYWVKLIRKAERSAYCTNSYEVKK